MTGPDRPDIHAVPVLRAGIDFPDSRRSDHASFWDVGITAVMLTDNFDFRTPHYHSQTDTTETSTSVALWISHSMPSYSSTQNSSVQEKHAAQSSMVVSKSVYAVVGELKLPLDRPTPVRTNRCDSWCRGSYRDLNLRTFSRYCPFRSKTTGRGAHHLDLDDACLTLGSSSPARVMVSVMLCSGIRCE